MAERRRVGFYGFPGVVEVGPGREGVGDAFSPRIIDFTRRRFSAYGFPERGRPRKKEKKKPQDDTKTSGEVTPEKQAA